MNVFWTVFSILLLNFCEAAPQVSPRDLEIVRYDKAPMTIQVLDSDWRVVGTYSLITVKGTEYIADFVADENGFLQVGKYLPTDVASQTPSLALLKGYQSEVAGIDLRLSKVLQTITRTPFALQKPAALGNYQRFSDPVPKPPVGHYLPGDDVQIFFTQPPALPTLPPRFAPVQPTTRAPTTRPTTRAPVQPSTRAFVQPTTRAPATRPTTAAPARPTTTRPQPGNKPAGPVAPAFTLPKSSPKPQGQPTTTTTTTPRTVLDTTSFPGKSPPPAASGEDDYDDDDDLPPPAALPPSVVASLVG